MHMVCAPEQLVTGVERGWLSLVLIDSQTVFTYSTVGGAILDELNVRGMCVCGRGG